MSNNDDKTIDLKLSRYQVTMILEALGGYMGFTEQRIEHYHKQQKPGQAINLINNMVVKHGHLSNLLKQIAKDLEDY